MEFSCCKCKFLVELCNFLVELSAWFLLWLLWFLPIDFVVTSNKKKLIRLNNKTVAEKKKNAKSSAELSCGNKMDLLHSKY